jgi:hypothetical protein
MASFTEPGFLDKVPECGLISGSYAGVMKLVDVPDSKSGEG